MEWSDTDCMIAEASGTVRLIAGSSPCLKRTMGLFSDTDEEVQAFVVRLGTSRYSLKVCDGSG
jgi:hypothetical protein